MRVRPVVVSLTAVLLTVPMALVAPSAAFAGRPLVDPNNLNPVPHSTGKPVCAREGNRIVCRTTIDINVDIGTSPSSINCGGGADLQQSVQWTLRAGSVATYNASGNALGVVWLDSYTGSFSNPATGKSVAWTQRDRYAVVYTTPGDDLSGTSTLNELQKVYGPAGNVILTDAGQETFNFTDGTLLTIAGHHPLDAWFLTGDPTGLAPLCHALT